jgi:pantoate kinase
MSVTAYCPGHISGYFRRVSGPTPAQTGSTGAGIVIDPGVTVTVSAARQTRVRVQVRSPAGHLCQVADRSPPLADALVRLGVDADIVTECRLPIGAGFGLSAAALLAGLTAVNRLYDLALGQDGIARIAHETEVRHRTGLGDVAACQGGGRVVRYGPGIAGKIDRFFDIDGPLHAVSFGPISTPSVLCSPEQMDRVHAAYPGTSPRSAAEFFLLAGEFSKKSGLVTPRVRKVLSACRAEGIPASMTMLGDGVFASGGRAGCVLLPFGTVYRCRMARQGPRIVTEDP